MVLDVGELLKPIVQLMLKHSTDIFDESVVIVQQPTR
jgi:hypothetical protein